MATQKPLTKRGRILFGGIFIIMGIIPVSMALNLFDPNNTGLSEGVPVWVGVIAGGVFIVAGLAVIAGNSIITHILALLIVGGLAAIGSWIAFGAGGRSCESDFSLFGLGGVDSVQGLACRVPFGIGTVIVYGILIYMGAKLLQTLAGGPPKLAVLLKTAEAIILITLLPILLPLVLFLILKAFLNAAKTRLKTGAWPKNDAFIKRQQAKGLLQRVTGKSKAG